MPLLPGEFSDLEPFAEKWCLATESERWAQRMASSIDEMQTFYDAILPRADEAMTYLEQFPLDALPDEALRAPAPPLFHDPGLVPRGGVAPTASTRHRRRHLRLHHGARPMSDETRPPSRPVARCRHRRTPISRVRHDRRRPHRRRRRLL